VADSPLREYRFHSDDEIPTLVVLHGDVGAANSHYAPIYLDDLWKHRANLWLLGHIHASRQYPGPMGAIALYPGSPLAMDPGEVGMHGVWLAEFVPGRPVSLDVRPLSPIHYVRADIDLSWIDDETDFMSALTVAMRTQGNDAEAQHNSGDLRVVCCRLHLTGRSNLHRYIPGWAERAQRDLGPIRTTGGANVHLDRLSSGVRPAIELEQFARGNDLAGETARLILELDSESPNADCSGLMKEVMEQSMRIHRHNSYASLAGYDQQPGPDGPTEADLRGVLREQAWALLSELVQQKESL
jgi:hypothetical protein